LRKFTVAVYVIYIYGRDVDNRYRPIIGRFADNRYRPIITSVLADYIVYTPGKYTFC